MKTFLRKIFGAFLYAIATSLIASLSFAVVSFISITFVTKEGPVESVIYMSIYVLGVSYVSCFLSFFLSYFPVFRSLWVNLCAAILATLVPISWGLIAQSPLLLIIILLSAIAPVYFGIKIFDKIYKHLDFLNSSSAVD